MGNVSVAMVGDTRRRGRETFGPSTYRLKLSVQKLYEIMADLTFEGFNWDERTWPKCGDHGMTRAEVELIFINTPAVHENPEDGDGEKRY